MDLEGSREGSPVRRMGSDICWEQNSSLVFTRREPRSNAEWHSVLQTKSRDEKRDPRDRLSQLPVEESGGPTRSSRGRGSGGPTETLLFVSSPSSSSDSFLSVLREGVPRETRGGDTPPALFLYDNWDSWSGGRD